MFISAGQFLQMGHFIMGFIRGASRDVCLPLGLQGLLRFLLPIDCQLAIGLGCCVDLRLLDLQVIER